ncbi:MAG TPA: cytochrome c biogenesis protein CcdA [Geminicoccaceae bacterium]|jgi:cytochrome c-type biogenesis protein|nr:cytochrome c biogenesis protein CcdA [Geminicoccaceae bacterium]
MPADVVSLLILPVGLGLLGFVEPCSIGSSLLFIKYVEGKDAFTKVVQAIVFTLTRAAVIGGLGIIAALIGAAFIGFQKAGWILLGVVYVVLGVAYLARKAGGLMRTLGVNPARLSGSRGTVTIAVLFGLNIPACAAPLLLAMLGSAAAGGTGGLGQAAKGFVSLAVFGLALSLPLALALVWSRGRRALDRLAALSARVPVVAGVVLVALGLWSIYFGLFVTPRP